MDYGTPAECARLLPVPVAGSGTIGMVFCNGMIVSVDGYPLHVNVDATCLPCDLHGIPGPGPWIPVDFCQAVPVGPSTWGSIKALYE